MSLVPDYSTYSEQTNTESGETYWECDCVDGDHVLSIPEDEGNSNYIALQEYIASEQRVIK